MIRALEGHHIIYALYCYAPSRRQKKSILSPPRGLHFLTHAHRGLRSPRWGSLTHGYNLPPPRRLACRCRSPAEVVGFIHLFMAQSVVVGLCPCSVRRAYARRSLMPPLHGPVGRWRMSTGFFKPVLPGAAVATTFFQSVALQTPKFNAIIPIIILYIIISGKHP